MENQNDALDDLYSAVQRLKHHGCDEEYIMDCVRDAYKGETNYDPLPSVQPCFRH